MVCIEKHDIVNKPYISICIPTYNQPALCERLLGSITEQTFKDYEVIVTDDSPNDAIRSLCERYNDVHGLKIKYYKNQTCLGSPGNWNQAISYATGKYIKIMHHDDWFKEKGSLTSFFKATKEYPSVCFFFSACDAFRDGTTYWFTHAPNEKIDLLEKDNEYLFLQNIIGAPSTTLIKREFIGFFDTRLKWVVDVDFYISILKRNKFIYIPEVLVCINADSPQQVTKECIQNREVNVFEWIYLYNKLDRPLRWRYVKFFGGLFKQYDIVRSEWEKYRVGNKVWFILLIVEYYNNYLLIYEKFIQKVVKTLKWFSFFKKATKRESLSNNECRIYRELISPDDLCFDIGANIGKRTETFLTLGARVIAVEPQPKCLEILRDKFSQNSSVVIVSSALGEKEGRVELSICDEAPTISTLSEKWMTQGRFSPDYAWNKKIAVSMRTLDSLIEEFGVPHFCKIDVEGYEYQVLQGLTRKIPYVSFEFTSEFIEDAFACMKYFTSLSKEIKFNFVIGEGGTFELSQWASFEEISLKIQAKLVGGLWGDIYVKSI